MQLVQYAAKPRLPQFPQEIAASRPQRGEYFAIFAKYSG